MTTLHFSRVDETLFCDTLENGLKLRVLKRPGFAKSFAMFAADYGGADRRFMSDGKWTDSPAGVAHFLEHKLFDMPDGGNALSILSANGASPNAFTSSGMTAYHFESTQGFYDNLRVLLSFVSTPYFTKESVAKEQGIIGQEIRMIEDDPDFVVYQNLMRLLYKHHPIRDSVAGSIESIAQISDKTLYDCHKVFYSPSNMALCVAGDLDPERVADLAREVLSKEQRERPLRDYGEAESSVPETKNAEAFMEVAAPLFAFGSRLTTDTKSLKERLVADLSLYCIAGRSSPLYSKLYADGLINMSFGTGIDYSADTAMTIVSGESRDPAAVFKAFMLETEKISRDGPESAMFERACRSIYGTELRGLTSFSHSCRLLAEGCFSGFEALELFEIIDSISAADVKNFVSNALADDHVVMSSVLPKS